MWNPVRIKPPHPTKPDVLQFSDCTGNKELIKPQRHFWDFLNIGQKNEVEIFFLSFIIWDGDDQTKKVMSLQSNHAKSTYSHLKKS